MLALTTLFFAACTEDNLGGNADDNRSDALFAIELPAGMATRTVGDGTTVDEVKCAVFDAEGNELVELTKTVPVSGKTAQYNVRLIKGRQYRAVFFAYNKAAGAYNLDDMKNIKVNTNGLLSNLESRDAFTAYVDIKAEETQNAIQKPVTLYRPFAQLNLGSVAEDITAARQAAGVEENEDVLSRSSIKVTGVYSAFNAYNDEVTGATGDMTFDMNDVPAQTELSANNSTYRYVALNYILVGDKTTTTVTFNWEDANGKKNAEPTVWDNVPLQRNYRTNILGYVLTNPAEFNITIDAEFLADDKYGVIDNQVYVRVDNADEFNEAFADENVDIIILNSDLQLTEVLTRAAADPALTVKSGKALTIDLNGKKLYATSTQTGKNYNMFDVRGTLTVKNGTMEYEHMGNNMEWSNSTNLFNVTAGGVLNLDSVVARNLGGSDMGFVAHLNNWGEVTLNVENSTLESNYVAVRVFNSGNDMNNVTIKNSTLKGGSYAFWVHNYTAADFGSEAKAETQKSLLNLNIYNQGNTFSPDVNGIRYGFTNSVKSDAYGITKSGSDDGSIVTLGSIVEEGTIRRGVAGTEGNNTIKEVTVGEGVATLYDRTFRRFYALETVNLPSTLTTIGEAGTGVFQSCSALKNIVIPESVTVLGVGTFYGCTALTSINIPAGVTRIEENCLRETGLISVEFHENVTYFGAQAFRDCKQLKEVIINAPEFTVEPNAFGVMSGALPGTIIYVANAEMKAYLEKTLAYASQFTVVAPDAVADADQLTEALANGENVVMTQDINTESATTAPYGNKYAFKLDGGVLDGNGHELYMECYGDDYGIMTSGGTVKNLTIKEGCRAIMIMYPQSDVILDKVNIGGDGVLYPINTGEAGAQGVKLIVTNSVLAGWTSFSNIESASFTNVEFKQGTYYNNIYGRVLKPYVSTTLTECTFVEHMNLDLSGLLEGEKVTFINCTVNGQAVTDAVFTVPSNDDEYDTELFTVDLPSWASSINDCISFE